MQQGMTESGFVKGTPVEVSLPDEHCSGAWFPATILKKVHRNLIMVEYHGLSISGMTEPLRDVLDIQHIRPSPPGGLEGNKFDALDIVDAFLDSGWWTGVVASNDGNRYRIRLQNQMEEKEFNQYELRSHVEWENETWIQDPLQENRKQTEGSVMETNILETTEQSKTALSKATEGEDPKYCAPNGEIVDVVLTDGTFMVAEIPVKESLGENEEVHPLSLLSAESHSLASIEASPDHHLALQSNMKRTEETMMEGLSIIEDLQHVPILSEESDSLASIASTVLPDNQIGSGSKSIPCSMQTRLPFVKTYPIWEEVESEEVFRSLPQHPHFQPLQDMNELLREGEAVAYMISFVNVANKTKNARYDEPKSHLEDRLNVLPGLEAAGFNVQPIRDRVLELLQYKYCQEQLYEELKQSKEKLIKEEDEVKLLKVELNAIDEKLRDLEKSLGEVKQELQRSEMEKHTRNPTIVALQEQRRAIKEKLEASRLEFSRIAAEPL